MDVSEIIIPREFIEKWYEEKYSKYQGKESYYGEVDPEIKDLIKRLLKNGKTSVLDLGCGDGRYLIEFAKAGFNAVGIDLSRAAKSRIEKRIESEGIRNLVDVINADIVDYHFENRSYDCVLCSEVLQQLPRNCVEEVIRKMKRATKNGGYNFIRLPSDIKRILPDGTFFWYEGEAKYSRDEAVNLLRKLYDDWKIEYVHETFFDEKWSIPEVLKPILGGYDIYTRREVAIKCLALRISD